MKFEFYSEVKRIQFGNLLLADYFFWKNRKKFSFSNFFCRNFVIITFSYFGTSSWISSIRTWLFLELEVVYSLAYQGRTLNIYTLLRHDGCLSRAHFPELVNISHFLNRIIGWRVSLCLEHSIRRDLST